MEMSQYVETLIGRFKKHFVTTEDKTVLDYPITLHARHQNIYGRTFISKVDVIDQFVDAEEHFIKTFEELTLADAKDYISKMEKMAATRKLPNNHRRSQFVVTLVGTTYNEEVGRFVQKYQFHKGHCFGIKGWTDIVLVYTTLDTKAVYTSKHGESMQPVYTL